MKTTKKSGFTIIELIVVIAVVAVLTGIVAVNVIKYIQKSRDAKLALDFQQIEIAAKMDYAQCGDWAIDVCDGEPPRFVDPGFDESACASEQPNNYNCPDAKVFYPQNFDASYYCDNCNYDWENWSGGPDPAEDCIIIDIRQDGEVLRAKCISTAGCTSIDCDTLEGF